MINRPLRPTIRRGSIREFFGGDPNLKGCWSLDGHARDESGNGNHGTVSGAIPYPGKFGRAYYFDGINDYISCGNINLVDSISILTWVYFKTIPPTNFFYDFLSKGTYGSAGQAWSFEFQYDRTLAFGISNETYVSFLNAVALKWYLLTITFDKSLPIKNLKLFGDSVLKSYATRTTSIPSTTDPIQFGRGTLGNYSNVIMDDSAILSRALSPAEISQYYRDATLEPRKYWFYNPVVGGVIVPWHLFPQNTLGQGVA